MEPIADRLVEAWARARAGEAALIHLVGPLGFGKSAVLDALLDRVGGPAARGVVVRAGFGERDQLPGGDRGRLEGLITRIAEGVRVIDPPEDAQDVPWLLPGGDFLRAVTEVTRLPGVGQEGSRPAEIHANLLLHVVRHHPVLLALDDVHAAGTRDRATLEAIAQGLARGAPLKLLVVAVGATPLGESAPTWSPAGQFEALAPAPLEALAQRAQHGQPGRSDGEALRQALAERAGGSPALLDLLAGFAARHPQLSAAALLARPEVQGLATLARGALPPMPARIHADLRDAAVIGPRLRPALVARLWGVPQPAAVERLEALEATGLVHRVGDRFEFVSASLATCEAEALSPPRRQALHERVAQAMLEEVAAHPTPGAMDVTDTWSERRRLHHREEELLELLWQAAWHFAKAGAHAEAADAALRRAERLLADGADALLSVTRFSHRAQRERRQGIERDLLEAEGQLALALDAAPSQIDPDRLAIEIRLLTARARARALSGSFADARRLVETAAVMARHLPETCRSVRLEALQVQVEVGYASGDHNAGRASVAALLKAVERADDAEAVRRCAWLAEAVGRFEWVGLHDRIFPSLLEVLRRRGGHREAIKARVERLSAALDAGDGPVAEMLLAETVEEARLRGQRPYLAELLGRQAAELVMVQVEMHFDDLSGEFYPPDLFGEADDPERGPLRERLARPVDLLNRAEVIAESAGEPLSHLRVLTGMLALIYDVRERLGELYHRWWPSYAQERPLRLLELEELLGRGFFDVDQLDALTRRVLVLAQTLGLDQVFADTLYEALERDLPSMRAQRDTHFEQAWAAYARIGDTDGQINLALVTARGQAGDPPDGARIQLARDALARGAGELSAEQLAVSHLRLGELLLDVPDAGIEAPLLHFEQAFHLFDQEGDVQQMQTVAEFLRDVYRKQGDLSRYRTLRERFRALEDKAPGIDPLGLEFRIEHLLNLARQEPDEQRAIEMVERCVQLFSRVPDGTTRVDECFVEISKLCRRRADDATTEAGFQDWLQRSLDAVRTAGAINRELGNYRRLFEESRELYDDLLGLGAFDDYLRARGEGRALAFGLGNVGELLGLFDEHLRSDPSVGFEAARLPEIRGFYEALIRYLLGLGVADRALNLKRDFVRFLEEVGEEELAEYYAKESLSG